MKRKCIVVCMILLVFSVGNSYAELDDPTDPDSGVLLPVRAFQKAHTTRGTVVDLLAYESDGDAYYFRLKEMPKGIGWFKSKSAKTFSLVQLAARKQWMLRLWYNENGDVHFVKSIVSPSHPVQ